MREKQPLRDFARHGGARPRRGRSRRAADRHAEHGGGVGGIPPALRFHARLGNCGGFLDDDRPHAGKVETAQERANGQLAGPTEVHQKLDHGAAQLLEFAREFISARQLAGVILPRQQLWAGMAQRPENLIEAAGQAPGLLFGPDAGNRPRNRQRHSQRLRAFLVTQVAHKIGKKRQPVRFREQHVHGQLDAERLRDFPEPGAQVASRGGHGLSASRNALDLHTDQRGARRLPAGSHHRSQFARPQVFRQVGAGALVVQQLAAGFYKNGLVRIP